MTTMSEAYWEGRREEKDRQDAKAAAAGDVAAMVRQAARKIGRDSGVTQRIFARSPHIFSGMDAAELGAASPEEMAARELKELGIDPRDNDPVAILDAHHAGREYARQGRRGAGLNASMDGASQSWLDKYVSDAS
jgi:hypothetical protein